MKRYFGAMVLALVLTAITVPTVASAGVTAQTFGDTGTRFDAGRFVQVSVQATCTVGEILIARVTVTQVDAVAESQGALICSGNSETFPGTLRSLGGLFEAGAATICGLTATTDRVRIIDSRQNCETVTLI